GVARVLAARDRRLDAVLGPAQRLGETSFDQPLAQPHRETEMQLAVEMDMSQLPVADIEIGTVDLAAVVEVPMRRGDDAGPGLDFARHALGRAFQLRRRADFAFRFEEHGGSPSRPDFRPEPSTLKCARREGARSEYWGRIDHAASDIHPVR